MINLAKEFSDSLSDDVKVYLKKKKGELQTGEALDALTYRLNSFLSYLEDNAFIDITEDVTTGWIASLSHYADKTINNYICDVKGFLEFENLWRATHYFIPECIKADDLYQPHFFTADEKKRLYEVIDNYIPGRRCFLPWIRLEFPMVVRICDGCGTRITETLRLRMRDVDLETGVLKIVKAKNNKQRYVPMTQGLTLKSIGIWSYTEITLLPRFRYVMGLFLSLITCFLGCQHRLVIGFLCFCNRFIIGSLGLGFCTLTFGSLCLSL